LIAAGEMASAEITRAECWERARLLRVRSYDVVLDLTREESFGSVSVIRFDCAEPGAASEDAGCVLVSERLLSRSRLTASAELTRPHVSPPVAAGVVPLTSGAELSGTRMIYQRHRPREPPRSADSARLPGAAGQRGPKHGV
jgi:hypothetical protein